MRTIGLGFIAVLTLAAGGGTASAQTMFTATLDGSQENPPVTTGASGTATLTLNAAQDALSYSLTLTGVDLDGLQTVDPSDDVTNLHFHNAPPGVNGGVVFGVLSPGQDPDDLVFNGAAGTVSGIWEEADPASAALSTQVADFLAGNLYLNVHTTTNPGGEIRGQIMAVPVAPTAGPMALAALALLLVAGGLWFVKRRTSLPAGLG